VGSDIVLKAHPDTRSDFRQVMAPESVVVVGASPTHQWGRLVLENFARINYPGKVVAVNPKYDEIAGYPCYPSIGDLPFVPDSVMVSINRERAVGAIEEAAAKGIKGAVVIAIGFAEAGPEGRALQVRLTSAAREAGMSLIGPNCQGVVNFVQPSAQYMDTVHPYEPGRVALFAQSGSITTAVTNNPRGVRWSHIVSCGNEAVSGAADLLGYFVDDPSTDIIAGFIEAIRRPEQFFHECDRAYDQGKPVVILKSGRTEAARNMAATHSGALAMPDRLVDELLKRHHVLRVDSMEELLATVLALQGKRVPGNRFAVVTASGGQIELALDEIGKYDIRLPAFTPETQEVLRGVLPSFLEPNNPLDWWGITDYEAEYPNILRAVANDPNIDAVVAIADTTWGPTGDEGREKSTISAVSKLSAETDKLLAIVSNIDGSVPGAVAEDSLAKGALYLSGFPVGFRALERAMTFAREPRKKGRATPPNAGLAAAIASLGDSPTGGNAALEVLRAAGIETVQSTEAASADEAVAAAASAGYPVVAKIGDADRLHKSEVGGVILGIRDEAGLRAAWEKLQVAGAKRVLIQRQVPSGVELILGLTTDDSLGTFVLVGLGGIWTEVFDDVAFRPAGLLEGEAEEMLGELRTARLLDGVRGAPAIDRVALVRAIEALDALGQAHGAALQSVDINPLVVSPDGAVAVDAVIVPRSR
jgi:acyl-CoA synthetase (NDP forming)